MIIYFLRERSKLSKSKYAALSLNHLAPSDLSLFSTVFVVVKTNKKKNKQTRKHESLTMQFTVRLIHSHHPVATGPALSVRWNSPERISVKRMAVQVWRTWNMHKRYIQILPESCRVSDIFSVKCGTHQRHLTSFLTSPVPGPCF